MLWFSAQLLHIFINTWYFLAFLFCSVFWFKQQNLFLRYFFLFFSFFGNSHPDQCGIIPHLVLICISLVSVLFFIFSCAYLLNVIFGERWRLSSIQVLCPFFNWVIWFLLLSYRSPLLVLSIAFLSMSPLDVFYHVFLCWGLWNFCVNSAYYIDCRSWGVQKSQQGR